MDDLIDFPVSLSWRRYYAMMGMTYDSREEIKDYSRQIEAIQKEIESLRRELGFLRAKELQKNVRSIRTVPTDHKA